jgi:hypothetical protein
MLHLRGITVCVNYADLLRITLWRNMRHLSECLVVTSPDDHETVGLCRGVPGVSVHVTDAFTRHGAKFNKGLALEETFDVLGRHGWILIWDADILLPEVFPWYSVKPGYLHGVNRRQVNDPARWHPDKPWRSYLPIRDGGPVGFFQLFQAEDPALAGKHPWYDVTFTHAGGGDARFLTFWDPRHRLMLPVDVLHFGSPHTNWFGVDQAGRDMMARYVHENKWSRAMGLHSQESADRAPQIQERVNVPGYPMSDYELPFVQRARQRQPRR